MSQEKYLVPDSECLEFFSYIKKFKELNEFYVDGIHKMYKYNIDNETFYVYESSKTKITTNCKDYNCGFNKYNGYTIKFGALLDDDPIMCKLGPEIMDLEISVNGCPKVGGHNCKFCYKNNSDAPATNMTFETFKRIVDSFPKCLNQIAFGITGTQTNPDFPKMLRYCRELGIIPNYTMSGADLNDDIINVTKECCGAVAISCYEHNKELCYNTIAKLAEKAPNVHVNMHIVLSRDTLNHVMDVLRDLRRTKRVLVFDRSNMTIKSTWVCENEKLKTLRNIVFLRIKPVGRASKLDTTIPLSIFEQVMNYCNENHISYGFDSCSAPDIERILRKQCREELCQYCESCESGRFSSYISVAGEYWHCSFAERDPRIEPIKVTDYDFAADWWYSEKLNDFRKHMNLCNEMDCPLFNLTANE